MSYFATPYTIHFDDTMAYGSHHFLTAFKLQCAGRESLLFGERVFDTEGVREALDQVHLLTADAYARNLNPARLGDRLVVLVTFEERGQVGLRFCFRVLDATGRPICAGFQTVICADPSAAIPVPFPAPLRRCMDALAEIDEVPGERSFRDRVLAGGRAVESLFGPAVRAAAQRYLACRDPDAGVVTGLVADPEPDDAQSEARLAIEPEPAAEAWVFSGQGSFDAGLLCDRIAACPELRAELDESAAIASQSLGGDGAALLGGDVASCLTAIRDTPALDQVAIFVQNVLGAQLRRAHCEPRMLVGHSFGELAAMCVASCYSLSLGVRIVCERTRAVTSLGPTDGGLLAIAAAPVRVHTEIARLGDDDLVVAGRNHPLQTIVSGPRPALRALRERLGHDGVAAVLVRSPSSFHHRSLARASHAWHGVLRTLPLRGPSRPLYSPIGRHRVGPDDDIAAVLAGQLLRPFDLQGALEDLVGSGVTRLVDCGTTGSLSRLLRNAVDIEIVSAGAPSPAHEPQPPAAHTAAPTPASTSAPAAESAAPTPASTSTPARPPVAIVGAGCMLPAGARDPESLWAALTAGRSGVVDLRDLDPRWEADFYAESLTPDRSTSGLAGVVDDTDLVAPAGVDDVMFAGYSRAQKLLAIALAPCRASLPRTGTVVCLVGATADGFEDLDETASLRAAGLDPTQPECIARMALGTHAQLDPHGAVQRVLDDVMGPGIRMTLVDAACASSLYTVALGMRALETFEADAVIAGGVFCPGPGNNCLFSQFGGLTSNGCRPFDASADGVVFSEGAAFVVLRRVADAERAHLPIAAVVRGAGLSSDGRSPSANVPQTGGQVLALERCYASYDIDPASIQLVEAHGTATPVGDATELTTLASFFGPRASGPIHVHSLKGLLGHAGWAAGTASVIATCEALRRGEVPAQANHAAPADALERANGLLAVPSRSQRLAPGLRRAAINGFGFGGADAHLVLESYEPGRAPPPVPVERRPTELVVVASHGVVPSSTGTPTAEPHPDAGTAFDRAAVGLPPGVILLPDLVEDMDISQTLALSIVSETLARIPSLTPQMRQATSVVLAMSGKTERGVQATMRVLSPRLQRRLAGTPAAAAIESATAETRPSGPYTLQCMMPNVSSGRAASRFDLKGPNFVVDAGRRSLDAALTNAALLLADDTEHGVQMVVVTAINANPCRPPCPTTASDNAEIAAGFAVTTPHHAATLGLEILCRLHRDDEATASPVAPPDMRDRSGAQGARALLTAVRHATAGQTEAVAFDGGATWVAHPTTLQPPDQDEPFPIHQPVWIEVPNPATPPSAHGAMLMLAPDDTGCVTQLLDALPTVARRGLIAIAGPHAERIVRDIADPRVLAVDLHDEPSAEPGLSRVDDFAPDCVVAIAQPRGWDPTGALAQAATSTAVRELLFLVAKRSVPRLADGAPSLWGLCPGAWSSQGVAHPVSGALSGCLKSIQREHPRIRAATLCTRDDDLGRALQQLARERASTDGELEIAYDGDTRHVRRLQPTGPVDDPTPRVELGSDAVVVATGGARGITAVMVEALLREHGCTVIALGRSQIEAGPPDPDAPEHERDYYARRLEQDPTVAPHSLRAGFERLRARWEAHRTLADLSTRPGQVHYLPVDITSHAAVTQAVQDIVQRWGRIDLLVHGAGVQWSKRIERRSLSEFRTTLDVKLLGLHHLVQACATTLGRLVPVHALSSAYSVFGNDGQADYGAANETLDRVCHLASAHARAPWSSLAWLAWDGIGMTRGSEYRALAQARGLSGIDRAHGQRLFLQVMGGHTAAATNIPLTDAERTRYAVPTVPAATGTPARQVAVALADLDCLAFHHVRGKPTLPGAWALERMIDAVVGRDRGASVVVENLRFSRFMRMVNGREPNLRAVVEPGASPHGTRVRMVGDVLHETGLALARDLSFCEAHIKVQSAALADPPQVNGAGTRRSMVDPYCTGPAGLVALSGPFDCLRDIEIGTTGRYATFVPPGGSLGEGVIPALLLDAAWRVSAMYAVPDRDELYVPIEIERVVAPLGLGAAMDATSSMAAGWQIRATAPVADGELVRCDRVEVVDQTGAVRLRVEGSVTRRLS